jgi:hypothetical protein
MAALINGAYHAYPHYQIIPVFLPCGAEHWGRVFDSVDFWALSSFLGGRERLSVVFHAPRNWHRSILQYFFREGSAAQELYPPPAYGCI